MTSLHLFWFAVFFVCLLGGSGAALLGIDPLTLYLVGDRRYYIVVLFWMGGVAAGHHQSSRPVHLEFGHVPPSVYDVVCSQVCRGYPLVCVNPC